MFCTSSNGENFNVSWFRTSLCLTKTGFNGGLNEYNQSTEVSVGPSADATPIYPITPTEHGGGVKKVIAVAAAVVIPIAAPAIASSLVASIAGISAVSAFAATTAGSVITSAVTGAALGAITAKVTGQSVKAGAIAGLIGGGIGGYGTAVRTGAGLGNVNQTGVSATDRAKTGVQNFFSGNNQATNQTVTGPDGNPTQMGTGPDTIVGDTTKLGGAGGGKEALSFTEKLAAVPSKVVDKITNPDTLANLTLQAGGQTSSNTTY